MENSNSNVPSRGMVTGMFTDRDSAERAYKSLESRGYTKDDVNLLMSDETRKRHFKNDDLDSELGTRPWKVQVLVLQLEEPLVQ